MGPCPPCPRCPPSGYRLRFGTTRLSDRALPKKLKWKGGTGGTLLLHALGEGSGKPSYEGRRVRTWRTIASVTLRNSVPRRSAIALLRGFISADTVV
jgi:hypothetical protein